MPREECGIRGSRATCRLGGPAGEESCRLPLRQRRSRRSRPSARSSHERLRWTRSRTGHGDAMVTGSPAHERHPGSVASILSRPAADHADAGTTSPLGVGLFAARRDRLKERSERSCTTLDKTHPLPSASNPPRRRHARRHRPFARPRATLASRPRPALPLSEAFAGAPSRQGSSPSGAKRQSRFERGRRARPEGRRQTPMLRNRKAECEISCSIDGRA